MNVSQNENLHIKYDISLNLLKLDEGGSFYSNSKSNNKNYLKTSF